MKKSNSLLIRVVLYKDDPLKNQNVNTKINTIVNNELMNWFLKFKLISVRA